MKKTILFELNELPRRVVDYFCEKYPNSTLANIRSQCSEYVTFAEDEVKGRPLEPWITWPTVHRGVTFSHHKIADYNQNLEDIDGKFPPIWKILAEHGFKVGVFSSLHTFPLPENVELYDFYFPDPFATGHECHPRYLSKFQDFNLQMSRSSGRNVSDTISKRAAIPLLLSSRKLGIQSNTLYGICKQLVHEKVNSSVISRRRIHQSILGFDVFFKLLTNYKPEFATFFTNHLASAMHRYWAATFPEDYSSESLNKSWCKTYAFEIDFAMLRFDYFLGRLVKFIRRNPEYQLLIMGSIGQAASEISESNFQMMLSNTAQFMQAFGLYDGEYERLPAMVPQINLKIKDGSQALFRERLRTFKRPNGENFRCREAEGGVFSIDLAIDVDTPFLELVGEKIRPSEMGIEKVRDQSGMTNSAWHTREGILLVYSPYKDLKRCEGEISTLAISPSLLEHHHVKAPDYMSSERIPCLTERVP